MCKEILYGRLKIVIAVMVPQLVEIVREAKRPYVIIMVGMGNIKRIER